MSLFAKFSLNQIPWIQRNLRFLANKNYADKCRRLASSHSFQTNEQRDEVLKDEILGLALKHVNSKGWSREAIQAGTEELDISGEVSNIFTEYDLVRFFITKSNDELESHLERNKLNLRDALEWRLQKIVPFVPKYNQALAYATQPENLRQSIQLLQIMADTIVHHSLKDTSTDLSWYVKRIGVASIYVCTELHLIQDRSENFTNTWMFLDRRVKDFDQCREGSILPFTNALPEVVSIGFTTVLNMLGRNKNR